MNDDSNGDYAAAVARLAGELAGFGLFPLEVNSRDGDCAACGCPVRAGHALVALGSDSRGTFAAHLHRGCAGDVRRMQDAPVPAAAMLAEYGHHG